MAQTPCFPQLPLSLGLKDSTVFANFVAGDNAEALTYLRAAAGVDGDAPPDQRPPCVYLWGGPGSGKSHLLQAVCHAVGTANRAVVYLPLRQANDYPLEALDGLENVAAVCLDDIGAVARNVSWQQGLMQLFERVQQAGSLLIVTGFKMPAELALDPALASRLAWGMIFQLRLLSDRDRREALRLRAERRGLRLGADALRLLVRHYGDDTNALFDGFERLDQASLATKRKLTAGFIREVLGLAD